MDIEKLRNLSQGADNEKEKQVLQICDPQQIAKDLMSELEIEATKNAKAGKRKANAAFWIWSIVKNWETKEIEEMKGPLVKSKNDELSKVLFNMVQRYITDSNIKLTLENWKDEDIEQRWILATVSW